MKQMMADLLTFQIAHGRAIEETRELKAKLGTNSWNSSKPPSSDPLGAPPGGSRPSGRTKVVSLPKPFRWRVLQRKSLRSMIPSFPVNDRGYGAIS